MRSGSVFFSCVKTKSVRETFFWPFLEFFHAQKIAFTHTFSTFFTHTFLLSRALFLSFQTFHGQFFTFLLFVFFTGTFFLFTGTFFDFFHASIFFFHAGKKNTAGPCHPTSFGQFTNCTCSVFDHNLTSI